MPETMKSFDSTKKIEMRRYSIELRTRKYVKEYRTIIGYRTRCCKNCFPKSSL